MYVEYTVAVILFTELIRKQMNLHAKWVSLLVGVIFAGLGVVLKTIALHEGVSVWKLIISYSMANVFYDYVLKVIKDKFRPKN